MKNKTGGDRRLSETDEEATVIEDQVRPGMFYNVVINLGVLMILLNSGFVDECMISDITAC